MQIVLAILLVSIGHYYHRVHASVIRGNTLSFHQEREKSSFSRTASSDQPRLSSKHPVKILKKEIKTKTDTKVEPGPIGRRREVNGGEILEPPTTPWVFNFSYSPPLKAAPPCNSGSFRFGRWIPGSRHCGLANRYKNDMTEVESELVPKNKIAEPYPFADWCWIPNHCTADLFSVEEFCRKLNGRWMLVVGDSLSHEFYAALFMQLRAHPSSFQGQFRPPRYEKSGDSAICTETVYPSKLAFVRNDRLSVPPDVVENVQSSGKQNTIERWSALRDWSSIAHKFGVLVLNKGAHYLPLETASSMSEHTAAYLKRYMLFDTEADRLAARNNASSTAYRQVIFRNTPQGSPHSSVYSHPNVSVLDSDPQYLTCEAMSNDNRQKYCDNWNWDKFPESDRVTIGILERELQPVAQKGRAGFSVLHAAEMSTLRPDGHRCWYYKAHVGTVEAVNETTGVLEEPQKVYKDKHLCDELHHYLPSVVDAWVYILHNLLL